MPGIEIHTDGSCHGNPGPGGYAAVIRIPDHGDIQVRGGDPTTTNNRMEMQAVVEGLTHLGQLVNLDDLDVQVFTDSEYVCNGFNKGWLKGWLRNGWRNSKGKAVANQDLWEELLALTDTPNVTFTHVKGHSGNPMNEACDRLANQEAHRASREGTPTRDVIREEMPAASTPAQTQEKPDGDQENSQAYARGFRDGYLAAKRDMAGALNGLEYPVPPVPDDLRF